MVKQAGSVQAGTLQQHRMRHDGSAEILEASQVVTTLVILLSHPKQLDDQMQSTRLGSAEILTLNPRLKPNQVSILQIPVRTPEFDVPLYEYSPRLLLLNP